MGNLDVLAAAGTVGATGKRADPVFLCRTMIVSIAEGMFGAPQVQAGGNRKRQRAKRPMLDRRPSAAVKASDWHALAAGSCWLEVGR